jgi:phage-related minor tail protein
MTDSLVEFFETGKLGMRDMVNDMLKQFQRLIVQRSIVNPLLSAGLGFLSDTFGMTFQDSVTTGVEPRAKGGSVTAGNPYLVGEQGMELFVPRSSGTIVPNHALAGGQPPVNVNFQVDATDANSFDNLIHQRQEMIVGMIEQAFNRQGKVGIYG